MRFKIRLAYEGTAYSGWQIQEKANPPPTIQGAVETALFAVTGEKTRVFGAGRTDAGVHAHGQAAHFDVADTEKHFYLDWARALNAHLPADIRIIVAAPARPDFNARADALRKTYVYNFWLDRHFTPPMLRHFVWSCGKLDIEAMRAALPALLGEHDFTSFQNTGTNIKNPRREIVDLRLKEGGGPEFYKPVLLCLHITATGFLKQMARNIAGFLAFVGQGKLAGDDLEKILAKGDRRALPSPTAPARGLALADIDYGKGKQCQ